MTDFTRYIMGIGYANSKKLESPEKEDYLKVIDSGLQAIAYTRLTPDDETESIVFHVMAIDPIHVITPDELPAIYEVFYTHLQSCGYGVAVPYLAAVGQNAIVMGFIAETDASPIEEMN